MSKRVFLVSHQEFLKRGLWPVAADKVTVKGLKTAINAGLDIWGRHKRQPVEFTVAVAMQAPFESAARKDEIDASTVHYGKLSKLILQNVDVADQDTDDVGEPRAYSTGDLISHAGDALDELVPSSVTATSKIEILYPKASTFGVGAGAIEYYSHAESVFSRIIYVKDIRIPTLIGVNHNERAKKQLVIVNIEIDHVPQDGMDLYNRVEELIFASIENTAFETLEALGAKAIGELYENLLKHKLKESNVTLRLEKPSAVPFAEGPVIELYRTAEFMRR